MSSLIFVTNDAEALVATDTLAVDENGMPAFWTSKAFPLPHLRMIVAGTGAAGFATLWAGVINDRMVVRDVENLDHHTPRMLRELWDGYKVEKNCQTSDVTTTIYHFGLTVTDDIRVYAYRSTSSFQSESLPVGAMATKPGCDTSWVSGLPDDIPRLMKMQREDQSKLPFSERVHIGGEMQVLRLSATGVQSFSMGRFSDFDEQNALMFAAVRR